MPHDEQRPLQHRSFTSVFFHLPKFIFRSQSTIFSHFFAANGSELMRKINQLGRLNLRVSLACDSTHWIFICRTFIASAAAAVHDDKTEVI